MRYIAALTGLLLISIAPAAFAGNDCAARSEKVAVTEKDEFLRTCLAEASAPARIKEAKHKHKKARCEQNAKNMKLQGKDKGEYQEECLNKNQAAEVKSNIAVADANATPSAANATPPAANEKSSSAKPAERKHAAKKQKEHKKNSKKNSKKAVKLSPAASGVAETK